MDNERPGEIPSSATPEPPPSSGAGGVIPPELPPLIRAEARMPEGAGGRGGGGGRRSRSGWMWFSMFLLLVLGAILFMDVVGEVANVAAGGTSRRGHGSTVREAVVEDEGADQKIVLIEIRGVISDGPMDGHGRNMVSWVREQLERAGEDRRVRGVLLDVDSPGGEVLASDEISRALTQFQSRTDKPVVVSMGSVAASGGYYISAPCRWIVAHDLTMTGSIGVMMRAYNYRALMDKVGVRPQVFKSGRFKDMLSGEKLPDEVEPEERAMIDSMIAESFGRFKQVIETGRGFAASENGSTGRKLASDWVDYADGRVFSGRQAYQLGFVDELGNRDVAFRRVKNLADVREANLVRYSIPVDFSRLLGLLGKGEDRSIRLEVGMDLPRLKSGRLYFLSPSLVQ